jgi:hypothetical protein
MVKEGGTAAQNHIGAVKERMKGWNDAASTDPEKGGGEQLSCQLAGQVSDRIVPRQRRSRNMQYFGNFFDNIIASSESSSFCKNSFGKTIWAPKTASAGERPVSFLGCALSPRSTKGSSSDHVAAAACKRSTSLRQQCSLSTALLNSGW